MSRLQRRSLSLVASSLAICASLSLGLHQIPLHHFSDATYWVIALLAATPIIMAMVVIARYLARETDEYVRNIVIKAILWGFGVTMIADTVLGYLLQFFFGHMAIGIFSMDVFSVTTGIALSVQIRSNR